MDVDRAWNKRNSLINSSLFCIGVLCSSLSSLPFISVRHSSGKFLNETSFWVEDQCGLDWSLLCSLLNQQLLKTVVLSPPRCSSSRSGLGQCDWASVLCGTALCSSRFFPLISACQLHNLKSVFYSWSCNLANLHALMCRLTPFGIRKWGFLSLPWWSVWLLSPCGSAMRQVLCCVVSLDNGQILAWENCFASGWISIVSCFHVLNDFHCSSSLSNWWLLCKPWNVSEMGGKEWNNINFTVSCKT